MITRNKRRLAHRQALRRRRRQLARRRRGVLLLVVLSMLVLFMMIGTAFLLTSGQFRTGAKEYAKVGRVGNHPTKLLDRALYQVLRDTNNPYSVARYHSLLRDMYGTDGFEATVNRATYARSIPSDTTALGATQGQLIDIYIVPSALAPNDTPEPRHVIKLERDANDQTQLQALPLVDGYYNGALLTVTTGPARGQSTRILEYNYVGDEPAIVDYFNDVTNIWRLRVMAFARADGSTLASDSSTPIPLLPELEGGNFIVNGRPYNGTGVGYNVAASTGMARLSALQVLALPNSKAVGAELALVPNSVFFDPTTVGALPIGAGDPFLMTYDFNDFAALDYGVFRGPGGSDESYDAPDFQNMFLAHETVTPRARGRLVVNGVPLLPDDPVFGAADQRDYSAVQRYDVEDLPIPSFHRPALVNYWFHRLWNAQWLRDEIDDDNQRLRAILGDPTVSISPEIAGRIAAVKRKFLLRPIPEDHPNFDGSNPLSRIPDLSNVTGLVNQQTGVINVPYWELMGPWDVDNDKDGIPDSIWIDLGDPVQQAEDGTLYKPLYAFKIIDLDNRLNVNAHGTAEHINPPIFDPNRNVLAGSMGFADSVSTDMLPQGMGWGTADISLRPLFPVPAIDANTDGYADWEGNRVEAVLAANDPRRNPNEEIDSYATLLSGRLTVDNLTIAGRYGFDPFPDNDFSDPVDPTKWQKQDAGPGATEVGAYNRRAPDPRAQFDFHDYPIDWRDRDDSFATGPDLLGRFALGLGHYGHTVYEGAVDPPDWPILADSPYELDLSDHARRGARSDGMLVRYNKDTNDTEHYDTKGNFYDDGNLALVIEDDDAPYATADMERLLRASEHESGAMPSRLWDVVDAFDPRKLIFDPRFAEDPNSFDPNNPTSLEYAAAEEQAAINRHLATTDSYDLPVPGANFASRLVNGADGAPGRKGFDDDNNGTIDDRPEIGWGGSDDYDAVIRGLTAIGPPPNAPSLVPTAPSIVDLLRYRIQYERIKRGLTPLMLVELEAAVNTFAPQLLPPEVIAGQRMDINRPFGNGRDDNGNRVVDDRGDVLGNERLWDRNGTAMDFAGVPDGGVPMDHANGRDVNGDGLADIRDAVLARQLYARDLYVMAMLLVDEEYVASQEAGIPNNEAQADGLGRHIAAQNDNIPIEDLERELTDAEKAEALALVTRKLTARRIAQWAVNCADFKDADAIMTPFEYDEYPWDGWNVATQNGFRPLDGDISTNENWGPPENDPNNPGVRPLKDPNPTGGNDALAQQASRGVVWGAERPELLITETFAFHDRQATDELGNINAWPGPGSGRVHHLLNPGLQDQDMADDDLDQKLVPRGALFVELYNPWTDDAPKPAEFYRYAANVAPQNAAPQQDVGVLLNRLSNSTGLVRRVIDNAQAGTPAQNVEQLQLPSPVWRLAVVRDPTGGRMAKSTFELENVQDLYEAVQIANQQQRQIDPDGYGFEPDEDAERHIYFTTGTQAGRRVVYDRVNREFRKPRYTDYNNPFFSGNEEEPYVNLRIPPVFVREIGEKPRQMTRRYFLAPQTGAPSVSENAQPNPQDVGIAPIRPGRYAVVGPAGMRLTLGGGAVNGTARVDRFVTPISHFPHPEGRSDYEQFDDAAVRRARRFELIPSIDPDLQQILIADNGGNEFVRVDNGKFFNYTDFNYDGRPDSSVVPPTVAIPVQDLNISTPVEGYPSYRYRELFRDGDSHRQPDGTFPTGYTAPNLAEPRIELSPHGELEYEGFAYDRPFDMEFDLVRNGTTANYRSVHLQRLANPLWPWNPTPYDDDGNPNSRYVPELPVNPYRSIDSQSVDLTAFNGASEKELELPNNGILQDRQFTEDALLQDDYQAYLSPVDILDAPDHVIRKFVRILNDELGIPIVRPEFYRGTDRQRSGTGGKLETIARDLRALNRKRSGPAADYRSLTDESSAHGGEWGWHRLRRMLPGAEISYDAASNEGIRGAYFRQRMHFKSLERGYHTRSVGGNPPNIGWMYDPGWQPRLLWKQEPPNRNLILVEDGKLAEHFSDMVNVIGRDLLQNDEENLGLPNLTNEELTIYEMERHDFMLGAAGVWNADRDRENPIFDYVMENTLGMINEAYAPDIEFQLAAVPDRVAVIHQFGVGFGAPEVSRDAAAPPPAEGLDGTLALRRRPLWKMDATGMPITGRYFGHGNVDLEIDRPNNEKQRRNRLLNSTYPWFPWNDRPYISQNELLQVPASSSSLMLREYSVENETTPNPYDGRGTDGTNLQSPTARLGAQHSPYGHLLNFLLSAPTPATSGDIFASDGTPGSDGVEDYTGAPNFSRLLEFLQVPSRFVNTDTLLNPVEFSVLGTAGPMTGPDDPRLHLQPPFNRVSNFRDPGRVNLNTVSGRRIPAIPGNQNTPAVPPQIWSEVYDGIMHRLQDGERYVNAGGTLVTAGPAHFGPAWRDVVLSRRGYACFDVVNNSLRPNDKPSQSNLPDTLAFGLNRNFPTFFANPFRAPDAGDLVPLPNMVQLGVNASYLRAHPYSQGNDGKWGTPDTDDDLVHYNGTQLPDIAIASRRFDDTREAGFGNPQFGGDILAQRTAFAPADNRPLPNCFPAFRGSIQVGPPTSGIPLFSESLPSPQIDAERNPYFRYQPLTRLGNLVTTRSGVFAIWVTVGYFEVEPAPDWNETRDLNDNGTADGEETRARFGNSRELYDRVYPEGMQLGQELGIDNGTARRHRAFYIVDRTLPVGFKPGTDLNVEHMIRVRRRIE